MTEPTAPYATPGTPHQQETRARRLADLIATAHRRELGESERDELSRLVAGQPEPSTQTDEAKP